VARDPSADIAAEVAKAAQLANLGDERSVRYLEPPRKFEDALLEMLANKESDDDSSAPADAFATLARQPQEQLAAAIAEVRAILDGPSIQARCLECPPVAPVAIRSKDVGLLRLLSEWLS